jgi:hypothetical protein
MLRTKELTRITENLMKEKQITIRDTWTGFDGYNYDDFYINNNCFGGPRHFRIEFKKNGYTELKGGKAYSIKGYRHAAYDNFYIIVPDKYQQISHPIIHECVHYLQVSTLESGYNYVEFTGNNPYEYLTQKSELEAHYIQLMYILRFEKQLLTSLEDIEIVRISTLLSKSPTFNEEIIDVIVNLKKKNIF